jgi:hypothetical protein
MNYYAWEKIRALEKERVRYDVSQRRRPDRRTRKLRRKIERGWPPLLEDLKLLLEAQSV